MSRKWLLGDHKIGPFFCQMLIRPLSDKFAHPFDRFRHKMGLAESYKLIPYGWLVAGIDVVILFPTS